MSLQPPSAPSPGRSHHQPASLLPPPQSFTKCFIRRTFFRDKLGNCLQDSFCGTCKNHIAWVIVHVVIRPLLAYTFLSTLVLRPSLPFTLGHPSLTTSAPVIIGANLNFVSITSHTLVTSVCSLPPSLLLFPPALKLRKTCFPRPWHFLSYETLLCLHAACTPWSITSSALT